MIVINDFKRLSAQSGRISLSQGYHSVSQDITQSGRISIIQVGYHSFEQDITCSSRLVYYSISRISLYQAEISG